MSAMVPSVFAKELNELQLQRTGPRANATAGEPVESEVELFNDGRVEVGVWECAPGEFSSKKEGITEQMYFLAGDATIVGEDGTIHQIAPGSLLLTPDGWSGTWEIRQTVRKIYTIWQTH